MQRARRLASTAVVAVLAVSGLSACRNEPGVAAYVGGRTISDQTVQDIHADARRALEVYLDTLRAEREKTPDPNQQPIPDTVELKLTPQNILQALVGVQVLKGVVQDRKLQPTAVPPEQLAQQFGLPPTAKYMAVLAEYQGYLTALLTAAKPVELTEPDLRAVYGRLRSGSDAGQGAISYEQFTTEILTPENTDVLKRSYGLRNDLKSIAEKADVTFNPRYGASALPLLPVPSDQGGSYSLVDLPFDEGAGVDPVVVDLP
jgi:hypothetical protein